jgi:hypothetical protein
MNKKIYFGLVKKNGIDPLSNIYGFGEPEYELYLINDSDRPFTVKKTSSGGFKTFDDTVEMFAPQENDVDISIEPHNYILYGELYADSFDGAGQYEAIIEIDGSIKILEFTTSRGIGFLGSLIPCLNKYGRLIHPHIKDI